MPPLANGGEDADRDAHSHDSRKLTRLSTRVFTRGEPISDATGDCWMNGSSAEAAVQRSPDEVPHLHVDRTVEPHGRGGSERSVWGVACGPRMIRAGSPGTRFTRKAQHGHDHEDDDDRDAEAFDRRRPSGSAELADQRVRRAHAVAVVQKRVGVAVEHTLRGSDLLAEKLIAVLIQMYDAAWSINCCIWMRWRRVATSVVLPELTGSREVYFGLHQEA